MMDDIRVCSDGLVEMPRKKHLCCTYVMKGLFLGCQVSKNEFSISFSCFPIKFSGYF